MLQIVSRLCVLMMCQLSQGTSLDFLLHRCVDGAIRTYDIRAGKLYEEKIGSMFLLMVTYQQFQFVQFLFQKITSVLWQVPHRV